MIVNSVCERKSCFHYLCPLYYALCLCYVTCLLLMHNLSNYTVYKCFLFIFFIFVFFLFSGQHNSAWVGLFMSLSYSICELYIPFCIDAAFWICYFYKPLWVSELLTREQRWQSIFLSFLHCQWVCTCIVCVLGRVSAQDLLGMCIRSSIGIKILMGV